jgi:hypothetical protein
MAYGTWMRAAMMVAGAALGAGCGAATDTEVVCKNGQAVYELPSDDAETLAGVSVVYEKESGSMVLAPDSLESKDGKVTFYCKDGTVVHFIQD